MVRGRNIVEISFKLFMLSRIEFFLGICEVVRRIVSKAILFVIKGDIQEAAGSCQLCGGQIAGTEAAVHAMRDLFEKEGSEAMLLVDATNAFNSLNRKNALINIQTMCPSFSTVLTNTYRESSALYLGEDTLLSKEGTTQGDPLAMPMYALATRPLIDALRAPNSSIKQIWYADDAFAVGKFSDLREWWDKLSSIGPTFGYFVNAAKTWLVTKDHFHESATALFENSKVNITTDGRPMLGSPIGKLAFVSSFISSKVQVWVEEVERLSLFAESQPHAAYGALTHGLTSKWTYLCRTTPNIATLLAPLDEVIESKLLPNLTGRDPPCEQERSLLALPARLGGLDIRFLADSSQDHYLASREVTKPLVEVWAEQISAKSTIKSKRRILLDEVATNVRVSLSPPLQLAMDLSREKGASSWLTVLPLEEHGFTLHKQAFRDAIALRYGWPPLHLPATCACGNSFTVQHALSCPKGGFPSITHNEVRDLTANILTETCSGVATEPTLQPVSSERLRGACANTQDGACLDIVANGFWGGTFERAFFDVRVFNPIAPSNRHSSISATYRQHENLKKRQYEQRIREIEHSSFTPLVFSSTGGLAPAASVFYKRLASLLAVKWNHSYSTTMGWLRCRLSFSLLRSSIMCIRGARSSIHHFNKQLAASVDLAVEEAKLIC